MSFKFPNFKIAAKIPALIVGAAVIVAVAVGITSITTATDNANLAKREKLRALLFDRADALKFYLESIEQDMRSVSSSPSTVEALTDFKTGWTMLGDDPTTVLQRAYIEDNPHPTGEKEKLDQANSDDYYHTIHEKYHPWFRNFLKQRGYYDIFIFDLDGNLIYTVFKELDYATNLETGQWKNSDLGNVFRAARDSTRPGSLHFFDFNSYGPSHGAPASFISTPLFEDGEKVGVLAFQMPIARINAVMSNRSGLGQTGETFIVGQDYFMRSDSQFAEKSTILNVKVENSAISDALTGKGSRVESNDYRNMSLEMHTVPFQFLGAKWALTAAIGTDEISAPVRAMRNKIILISMICLLVIAAAGTFLARGITRPLTRIVDSMNKLAEGEMDVDTDSGNRPDEIGDMLRAVTVFRDNALERGKLEAEHARLQNEAEDNRRAMMRDLAENFSTNVGAIVDAVTSASSQLQSTATAMEEISEQTSNRATSVSAASEEASFNVQSVASSTEEMSTSIEEITRCVLEATAASRKAVEDVAATRSQMSALATVSEKIGGVVNMISEIAEQTNLLALNATIESARAGEAGRGFAVVASEVKALANQTAQATSEIAQQIQEMQTATDQAVTSMQQVSDVIANVEQTSTVIASAMEEQGAATQEIAHNVQEAAGGTRTVSDNISGLTQASHEAGQAAGQVMSATNELFEQSQTLRSEVSEFLDKLRSGDADRRRGDDPHYDGPERRRTTDGLAA